MDTGNFNLYNQAYTFWAMLAFVVSLFLYGRLREKCSVRIRLSLVTAALLSLIASFMPKVAVVLTVAFIPAFIYHLFEPLVVAPYVVGVIGFIWMWSALILLQELLGFVWEEPPWKIKITVTALIIFAIMGFEMRNGLIDSKIILNAEQILNYAATGKNAEELQNTYLDVTLGHDTKMLGQTLSLLALNRNTPPDLLTSIYSQVNEPLLEATRRSYILVALSRNPHTPSDLLKKIMLTMSQVETLPATPANLTSASRNPNFSHDTLLQLAAYPDCEIRRAIISYPDISETVLNKMISSDPDMGVRHDAKQRLEFLHGISHLEADTHAPAPHMGAPEEAQNIDDPDKLAAIYNSVDGNEQSASVLESLAANCYITEQLARDIYNKAQDIKDYKRNAVLIALAVNPKTPPDILNALAAEKDLAILRGLASNANIPYEIISKFAPFPDCKIRKEIICLPGASPEVLKQLRHDQDESVVLEATEREHAENTYLDICREMKKVNTSCQKFYGTPNVPEVRVYPSTSLAKPFQVRRTFMQFAGGRMHWGGHTIL
jgi:hypothetical protein